MQNIRVKELRLTQQEITPHNYSPVDALNRFFGFLDTAPKTADTYRKALKQFISFLNSRGIKNPKREDIIAFKKDLDSNGKKPATISLYLSVLRRFFSWCETEGLYPNITNGLKSPKISHEHKRDAFSADELNGIIAGMKHNTLEAKRNYAIFTLIASCGLRTIEVSRANVVDMHRVAGVWILDIQGKGRTSKDAFVKLADPVKEAIDEYLSARGHVSPNAPLFASCSRRNKGRRITAQTVSQVCKRAMIHAGYNSKRLTAHSLRHSAITIALMMGQSLDDVSAFARHSSISVTMIYNHSISRMKSLCENAIAGAIFRGGEIRCYQQRL